MEPQTNEEQTPKFLGLERRNVKLALYGFLIVLLVCMITLKPYLPSAIFHNFARITDYRFFTNRVVLKSDQPQAWPVSGQQLAPPPAATRELLTQLDTTALLVLENGRIVYEQYPQPAGGPSSVDEISGSFSMAKSIVALLTGFALQEGAIQSLDEPISRYITEWEPRDEGKITIRQLLRMTSGLNWDESYWNPFAITAEAYYGDNLLRTALRQRLATEPGTLFSYQSGTTQLLGLVVARAANKSLSQYASERLWRPLGAEHDALWSLDHENGMEKAYCCFNATARDFARLGQLVLQGGQWNGKPLLREDYVKEMVTPHGVKNEYGESVDYYGYQTWILKTSQGESVPYFRGILGQYVIVLPHKNRVAVRLGMKRGQSVDHHPEEVRAIAEWLR